MENKQQHQQQPRPKAEFRIQDLSPDDRPREKALAKGIAALSDTELLTIVIGAGLPGKSAIDVARTMLQNAGGKLSGIRIQSIHELIRRNSGIGPARAVSIAAAFELGVRCRDERQTDENPIVKTPDVAYQYIRSRIEASVIEHFYVITLSQSNRITGCFKVSDGGMSSTMVDVKVLIRMVVDRLAAGIILVHNHPSGNTAASPQDQSLTRRIKDACDIFGIKLLDHLIVTPETYTSFRNEGWL